MEINRRRSVTGERKKIHRYYDDPGVVPSYGRIPKKYSQVSWNLNWCSKKRCASRALHGFLWSKDVTLETKKLIYQTIFEGMCGAETWPLTKRPMDRLKRTPKIRRSETRTATFEGCTRNVSRGGSLLR